MPAIHFRNDNFSPGEINFFLIITAAAFLLLLFPTKGFVLEPPAPGEIERYKKDGSISVRMEFARKLKNNMFNPHLIKRKLSGKYSSNSDGIIKADSTLPYTTTLESVGKPVILVLLIDFPNFPHTTEVSDINNKIFGTGDPDQFPYESLSKYYYRSSYGALDIQGNVLGWYRAKHVRGYYSLGLYNRHSLKNIKKLIKEAFLYYDSSHNFSQYDNDGDGRIDYFCVIWTGPDTGWSSIWWAWADMNMELWANDPFTVDGKSLGAFSWEWEKNRRRSQPVFTPQPVIHETGHALGLPDYYDYDDSAGPSGGVGGLDMMDSTSFDHNCFSKWILGWISPRFITNGSDKLSLNPSSEYADSVAIMPGNESIDPFSEYFMVQYRTAKSENDSLLPNSGFLIWHIDARLNDEGDNFNYDNSYTEHKLLRLMEADGKEEIENLSSTNSYYDPEDFYVPGQEFTPISTPNSNDYSGNNTGIEVNNISEDETMKEITADFGIQN